MHRELLSRSRWSIISAVPDDELERIAGIIRPCQRVRGRADLEEVLDQLLDAAEGAATIVPRTLDLIGHSTPRSLLKLGDWVIDADAPSAAALFGQLAARAVLPRLGIHAVRLLACQTAGTAAARATVCGLADLLGVEVFGTTQLLYDAHYDADGFRDVGSFMLVAASDLRRAEPAALPRARRSPCCLDIDALPAMPLGSHAPRWARRVASGDALRGILAVIRRDAGAPMPGPFASPDCELVLPSAMPGAFRVLHVVFDGAFVRCFPDGLDAPGLIYPVEDAPRLRRIVGELPTLDVIR